MHRFRIMRDLNLVIMEFGERLDDHGLRAHLLTVYDHPRFERGMDEISSFLRTRVVDLTPPGLRDIARLFPRHAEQPAPPNAVAVTRPFGAYADRDDGRSMDIFPTVAAAADWLDGQRGRPPGTTAGTVETFTLERQ